MITDKHSQTLIFWRQKSLSPTSNSKIHHLNSSLEQSDLSSLNSLNKNEHYKSASQNIHRGHNSTQEHKRNFANTKVPSKNQQFWRSWKSLSQVFPDFSFGRDTTRLTKPRRRTIRIISLLIEYGSARFVTHIVTHRTWPRQKGQIPTLNLPSFQNIFLISIFFQIWRFSFWRLFSVGDSIARFERFD